MLVYLFVCLFSVYLLFCLYVTCLSVISHKLFAHQQSFNYLKVLSNINLHLVYCFFVCRASSASRVSPANLDKVDEMKAAAAAAKMEVTPQEIEPEPVPMETDADRKRKEKEKRREVKVRRVQETMVSMRRKQGIFKPDDNYHAVPDWELMCLMASKPSNDWTYEHDEELVRYLHREIEKGSMIVSDS